jgi:hypothetical protein
MYLVWPDELRQREVIWPLRFRIHVLKVLPQPNWENKNIKINDFGLLWRIGFQLLRNDGLNPSNWTRNCKRLVY